MYNLITYNIINMIQKIKQNNYELVTGIILLHNLTSNIPNLKDWDTRSLRFLGTIFYVADSYYRVSRVNCHCINVQSVYSTYNLKVFLLLIVYVECNNDRTIFCL